MKPKLEKIVDISRFVNKFQLVERVTYVPKTNRKENDAEHSFALAMIAWYLVDTLNLKLDIAKVIKYCLSHDLVEVYAGDTYTFTKDEKLKTQKHKREEKARKKIEKTFPEFADLHKIISIYEDQKDSESLFVHQLDKLLPVILNFTDGGRTWKEKNLSIEELIDNKRKTIGDDKVIRVLFEEIISLIKKNPKKYFN